MPEPVLGPPFPGDPPAAGRYPFADGATLATDDGLTLPAGAVLDARVYVVGSSAGVGLASIAVDAAAVTLAIGDDASAGLASARFPRGAPIPAALPLADAAGRLCGLLRVDPVALSAVAGWPAGTHAFPAGAAELVASTLVPRPERGLRSIAAGGAVLSGDVWLLGSAGVTLSVRDNVVYASAVGEPLFAQLECGRSGGTAWAAPAPLRTVNGVGPDARGGFVFVAVPAPGRGGTVLRIDPRGTDTIAFGLAGPPA